MSQPKCMSSRLLTMKFMQRAAASGISSNSSPGQTPPESPSSRKRTEDTSSPSFKRRKTSGDSPSQRAVAHANDSDIEAISAAIQAEDNKRSAAIARQAADAGETQWVLEYPAGTIKSAARRTPTAKAKLDNDEDEDNVTIYEGRKSYGGFKKKRQTEAPEPSETPKPDINTDNSAQKGRLNSAMKIGRISSGGISANNLHKGKNWKNRQ